MPSLPVPSARRARAAAAVLTALTALTALVAAPPAHAQIFRRPATSTQQTASVNIIGLPFGLVSGEYERAVGREGFAVGIGGALTFSGEGYGEAFSDGYYGDDERFSTLQAKLKYYPAARGLRGFAVGVTAGVASTRGTSQRLTGVDTVTQGTISYPVPVYQPYRDADTRATVGTVVDYNFLIGRRQRFLIGLGVGARRTLGADRRRTTSTYTVGDPYGYTYYDSRPGLNRTLFDGRFQIGVGF